MKLLTKIVIILIILSGGQANAFSSSEDMDIIYCTVDDNHGFDLNNFDNHFIDSMAINSDRLVDVQITGLPLDTLEEIISQIEPDSIQSYIIALESFLYRVVGSEANAQAREWLMVKLEEFGYTPVLDTCSYGSGFVHNIMAYKEGISFSNKYIIIGAHYDAVPLSPGAGDNGSGVAGVLEIARILRNRNTHYTFVLSFFDGEEVGVVGSSYMADRFKSNSDSILAMFNMDTIGWNDTTGSSVRLYYGNGQNWLAQLFGSLAQSLEPIFLQPMYLGSSFHSDHYPFQTGGYNALWVLNYPPFPYGHAVYGAGRDSSTYVNFGYAARIVRGVMATALDLDYQYQPSLGLIFDYPEGLPAEVSGEVETSFKVHVSGIAGGVPIPGTGQLYYSIDGNSYNTIPMTDLGAGLYAVSLPKLNCSDSTVRFFVGAEESGGGSFYDPDPSKPHVIPIVTNRVTAFFDDFEIFRGWSYDGLWRVGSPVGMGSEFGSPDPVGGYNSAKCLGYNIYGDYENNLPERNAISAAINCSGLSNVHLKFWRWLSVQFAGYDYARIGVSIDGIIFTYVWYNEQQTAGGYWMEDEIDISSIADNQATVYVEFVMGPTDAGWSYCGWNIDDLEVYGYECISWVCGDADGSDKINLLDVSFIISFLYRGGPPPDPLQAADVDHNGKINLLDISFIINYLYRNGPEPDCP